MKTEGMAHPNSLGKQHDVSIYRDAKRFILKLYGAKENKVFVEPALVKTIEDLVVCNIKSNGRTRRLKRHRRLRIGTSLPSLVNPYFGIAQSATDWSIK